MKLTKQQIDSESPIDELRQIIEHNGEDLAALFSTALTIFAGPQAAFKDDSQKQAELEDILTRDSF